MVLWTKMMFSLLFTKSMTDLVEWLQRKGRKLNTSRALYCAVSKKINKSPDEYKYK